MFLLPVILITKIYEKQCINIESNNMNKSAEISHVTADLSFENSLSIIFNNIIIHLLNKILGLFQSDNLDEHFKNSYFECLKDIIISLNKHKPEHKRLIKKNINNSIIISLKQLIYKNVDSKAFKNPLTL